MKFNVLYTDPPWLYKNKKTGGSMTSGSASKYPSLTTEELCKLPIGDLADKDSVLFLWVTTPMLEDGLQVLNSWGYRYKTKLAWDKQKFGMGFWFRGQVEDMLLGVRGKVKAFRSSERNFKSIMSQGHSKKPKEFRELIEKATAKMPDRRMVEVFATEKAENWTSLGFGIDGRDVRDTIPELIKL